MGRIIHAGDRAVVLARRTTTFALPNGAFGDITLDATDIENDDATLEHDAVTDRINLVRDGLFWIYYAANIENITVGDTTAYIEFRVRVDDTTVISGSLRGFTDFEDGSIEGDNDRNGVSHGFHYLGTAGEFVTLQGQYTEISPSDPEPDTSVDLIFGVKAEFD